MYIFYPFACKTLWVCVDDIETRAEQTSVHKKNFWQMLCGKKEETGLLEIARDVL